MSGRGRNNMTRRARLVQEALTADPDYEDPTYSWCLRKTKEMWPEALAGAGEGPGKFERAKIRLIDLVQQWARRVRE